MAPNDGNGKLVRWFPHFPLHHHNHLHPYYIQLWDLHHHTALPLIVICPQQYNSTLSVSMIYTLTAYDHGLPSTLCLPHRKPPSLPLNFRTPLILDSQWIRLSWISNLPSLTIQHPTYLSQSEGSPLRQIVQPANIATLLWQTPAQTFASHPTLQFWLILRTYHLSLWASPCTRPMLHRLKHAFAQNKVISRLHSSTAASTTNHF